MLGTNTNGTIHTKLGVWAVGSKTSFYPLPQVQRIIQGFKKQSCKCCFTSEDFVLIFSVKLFRKPGL